MSNATTGYGGGRNRIRYERSFVNRPDLQPYEYYEHFMDAQRAIDNANSASEKWELQILHENRVAMSPNISDLPSLADVAGGIAMQPMAGREQDARIAALNDQWLCRPSEEMRANMLAIGRDPDKEQISLSELQGAVEAAYTQGRDELAVGLQRLIGSSEWAPAPMGTGMQITVGEEPLSYTPPARRTGPIDPSGYADMRREKNADQGLKALQIRQESGMPLGISPDGLSYDHYAATQGQAAMGTNNADE